MAGDYDHSKSTLGEACGFSAAEGTEFKEKLLGIFESEGQPSRIIEKVEQAFEKRELSMLLVGAILATQKLNVLSTALESVGPEKAAELFGISESIVDQDSQTIG